MKEFSRQGFDSPPQGLSNSKALCVVWSNLQTTLPAMPSGQLKPRIRIPRRTAISVAWSCAVSTANQFTHCSECLRLPYDTRSPPALYILHRRRDSRLARYAAGSRRALSLGQLFSFHFVLPAFFFSFC